jgi:hypothetical protein
MVNRHDSSFGDESEAQWDLRQVRAKIITLHLISIDESGRNKDYQEWIRNIRLLYKFVTHYVSRKVKDFESNYNKLLQNLIQLVNKHSDTYFAKNNKPEAVWALENALFELEKEIYLGMELSGLWGTKNEDLSGL